MSGGSPSRWTGDSLIRRLVLDENGQDLVEYALLAAIFGVIGFLMFPNLVTRMGNAYSSWGDQTNNLWIPPDPPTP